MDSLKRVLARTFSPLQAKGPNGVYVPSRRHVSELNNLSLDLATFHGLESRQRRKCRLIKALKDCIWYELEDVPHPMDNNGELFYFYDDTGGYDVKCPKPKDPDKCCALMLSHLQIIDEIDPIHMGKNIIFVTTEGDIVAYKLSRMARSKISLSVWKKHCISLRLALKTQRNNPRGIRRAGCFCKNVLFGFRREGNSSKVGQYAPKKNAKRNEIAAASMGIQLLVRDLERNGLNLVPHQEISVQNKLREEDMLGDVLINGYEGRFTQIAIATKYWSPLHIDDDFSDHCCPAMTKT